MPARTLVAATAVALLAVALVPAGEAGAKKPPNPPGRYRFVAQPGASLLVHGTYPPTSSSCVGAEQPLLHERYRGTVEVLRASDGDLVVIGELSFEDYVKGIAEVPRDWPMEALKAQVVAARTYAAANLDPSGSYDLCATDACQVYAGLAVSAGPWGHRWVRAVEETAGQILRHDGAPATAVYFSTSNGRTYGNEEVFGGAPLPYLRGQPETDDGESPLSRWTATFPFEDVARFLAADGRWSGRPIRSLRVDDGRIVVKGSRKRSKVVLGRGDLRDALNDWAACLEPSEYPAREGGGYRLPQPVPSEWFRAEADDETLVLEGRGWGHGVGMVQWGAYGKAKRGLTYDQILAAYYGGLRPQRVDLPATVRVLLAADLTSVTVVPAGDAHVGGGRRVPEPPWRLTGGRKLRLHHGPEPAPRLEASWVEAPGIVGSGEPFAARLRLSVASRVRLRFVRDGKATETAWLPYEDGVARLNIRMPPLGRGRYLVRAVAADGVDVVRSPAVPLRVRARPAPTPAEPTREAAQASPEARAAPEPAGSAVPAIAVVAGVLGILVLALLTVRRRRRLHRSS